MILRPETSSPVLTAEGVWFSYSDNPDILKDISIEVMSGQRVGLIGPNGAGKTTLFLVICGLLKPSTGQVSMLGKPVAYGKFNPQVALVFQNPDDQLFCPSVRDDVAFGLQNMGLPKEEVDIRVEKALATVGASKLAERPVHHLSHGEKRIVSIAGVLAMRPELLMYDEPSANLDIRSRRRLIRLLQSSGETILVASHDLELVLEVCERVILIDEGRIFADGEPREIMGDKQLMEAHGQEKPHSLIPHRVPHH
jgi:cobalt/nickel transport system ATP-binding protein